MYYIIDEICKFAGEITDETLALPSLNTLLDTAASPRLSPCIAKGASKTRLGDQAARPLVQSTKLHLTKAG